MSLLSTLLFVLACVAPSLLVSLGVTAVIRRLAPGWGLIDKPNHRKVHITPTPLGGGLGVWSGIVGVFLLGQIALWIVQSQPDYAALLPDFARPHLAGIAAQTPKLWVLLAGGTVLMLLGLADDRWGLHWRLRLFVQAATASACMLLVKNLQLTVFLDWPWLTFPLTVLWIVALVNAFNMLDNMDGLSGGVAVIAGGFLAAVMLIAPNPKSAGPQLFVAGLLLVLVGSVLGFLHHNRPPAKIFLGDAGSYLIGFLLASATLLASYTGYQGATRHAVLTPLLVMAVPLYDMASVIVIRLRNGKSPFEADKNHFSHRLVELGMSRVEAVLTVYLTTAVCSLAALLLHRTDGPGAAIVLVLVLGVLSLIAVLEAASRRRTHG